MGSPIPQPTIALPEIADARLDDKSISYGKYQRLPLSNIAEDKGDWNVANITLDCDLVALEDAVHLSKDRPVWLRVGQLVDGIGDRQIRNADTLFDAG
jgi:hypothetical protein